MNEEDVEEKDRERKQYKLEERLRRKRKLVIIEIKNNGRTLPNEKHREEEEEEENSLSKVKNKNSFKYRLKEIINEDSSVTSFLKYLGILLFGCCFILPFGLWSVRRITYRETSLLVTNGPVPISVSCVTVCFIIFSLFFLFRFCVFFFF